MLTGEGGLGGVGDKLFAQKSFNSISESKFGHPPPPPPPSKIPGSAPATAARF